MCGRYLLHDADADVALLLGLESFRSEARYNIAPTQSAPVVIQGPGGARRAEHARWGLIPHWVRDGMGFKAPLFNARSETLFEKPSFRDAARNSRCVVPASGYYEWLAQGGTKQPFLIERRDRRPMLFAAIYTPARNAFPRPSFAIVTCEADATLARLHPRMPVVLEGEGALALWLDPEVHDEAQLSRLLAAQAEGDWVAFKVGREVGHARLDHPGLRVPLD